MKKKGGRPSQRFLPKPLASLDAARYLTRARLYRTQAEKLADMVAYEPNWPKQFLITHAIELAITSFLVFERGLLGPRTSTAGKGPEDHDLLAIYEEAVRRGLKSNALVLNELPFLSKLHKSHYARYPQIEASLAPAHISDYHEMLDQLFADIGSALGGAADIRA
jgi:hypothetical protein